MASKDDKKDVITIIIGIGKITVHGASHDIVVKKIGEK